MIKTKLVFRLPSPWKDQSFETNQVGPINFLVGPNGSGKSRFIIALFEQLNREGNARFLGTDRLSEMGVPTASQNLAGDLFVNGYAKNWFNYLKTAGAQGSGIDTIMLLEERMDLRIQVEATLSHLFDREIILEWDSGNLVGKIRRRNSRESYRMDRDECHGIKELIVLLTHLYDDKNHYLIIDEPELNLHPQYQAFFMQEIRKLSGDPSLDSKKKVIFLITHSPFILDFRTEDDLNSVISFSLNYPVPKQFANLGINMSSVSFPLIPRLNAHCKQLFFSDNPVFVEGILDARLIEALMDARGVSVSGAGSCIIDAGGVEEVNNYLRMCNGLGKKAHFLYDLDSLFRGNLRACIRDDKSIESFLASAGLGSDFARYCGELDRKLKYMIDQMLEFTPLPNRLIRLGDFLRKLGPRNKWDKDQWAKARTAMVTAISRYREDVALVSKEGVLDIEGRLTQIVTALKKKNIHLLPGGTIERYLPCYNGDDYDIAEDRKQRVVSDEIQKLSQTQTQAGLSSQYGELYDAVCDLPSKPDVDVNPVLRQYLCDYIHELQKTIVDNPGWNQDQIQDYLDAFQPSFVGVFSIDKFERSQSGEFSATIEIFEMVGQKKRHAQVSHHTNAGMGGFEIVPQDTIYESTP